MPSNLEQQSGESQNSEKLQAQYRNLVEKSSILNEKDQKAMLDFLQTAEGKNPDTLKMMLEHFPEAEKSAEKINKEYKTQIEKEIAEGRFAKKSAEDYTKWFKELSFKEKTDAIKNKSTDLHDPKRQKLLDAFNGKTEFGGAFIPAAVRNEFRDQFFNGDIEEREALLKQIAAQHKKLKERFLALPKEAQAKYHEKFKELGLAEREKLLKKIAAEKGKKTPEQIGSEKLELQRMDNDFCTETKKMAEDNLLAPKSKLEYDQWFKALPLEQKRSMATRSELHTKMRERVNTRNSFYKLIKDSPVARTRYELKFRNADLDERKEILDKITHPEKEQAQTGGVKNWLTGVLKRIFGSRSHSDITKKMETFAVTNELAERRRRFRLTHHTREENAQKADEKGMEQTSEQSQKIQGAAGIREMQDEKGGMKVKLDVLESHTDERYKLKRALKPQIDDPNAKLSANITLRKRDGEEVIDERAYQRGEIAHELGSIQQSLKPIIEQTARAQGITLDEKQIDEELKNANWKEHGKDVIRKAA